MTEPNGAGGSGAVVRPAFCTLGNPVDASTNLFSLKVDESVKIQVYAVNITPPITNVSEVRKVSEVGAILHQGMSLLPNWRQPDAQQAANKAVAVDSTIQGNSQTMEFKHNLVLRGAYLEQEANPPLLHERSLQEGAGESLW
uniref:Uncharacterized protein n=1 Tax=Vitrella brassicaformis TaxID=1169539 RepID=A0A6U4GQV7_9ALVE|mmetsp:Transcript_41667/g.104004  ORF Transcript_41667/g.104004 Transcript_41667/m.104004 type:complete len:142 (+) Transcript_41667:100-525(+)